jgi:NaMN:DMB phosphoribosyltransferase
MVNRAAADGVTLVGIRDMGIANSTSAAALLCAITGADASRG